MKALRFDIARFREPKITPQGFLRADAYATRVGVFRYLKTDGSARYELRPSEEVFKNDSLESLSYIPLTNDHPSEMLNAENAKQYTVGFTGEKVEKQDGFVKVGLTVTDANTIQAIQSKKKVELSCGYTCDLEETPGVYQGQHYDAIQRNITYNHLALVEKGRAGSEVRVRLDTEQAGMTYEQDLPEIKTQNKSEGENKISTAKLKIDGVEYELPEGVAKVISDKVTELEILKKKQDELQGRYDSLKLDSEKKDQQIEELKKSKPNQKELVQIAKARIDLESLASSLLEADAKFDELSDLDLQKAILQKQNPHLKLDDKSEDYISGCFSILQENLKDPKAESLKIGITQLKKDGEIPDSQKARLEAMTRSQNAWKKNLEERKAS